MKEITKLEKTSLSEFKLHTEECQEQAFFSQIVCAATGGMTGSVKRISKSAKNADKEILKLHTKERKANRVRFEQRSS